MHTSRDLQIDILHNSPDHFKEAAHGSFTVYCTAERENCQCIACAAEAAINSNANAVSNGDVNAISTQIDKPMFTTDVR